MSGGGKGSKKTTSTSNSTSSTSAPFYLTNDVEGALKQAAVMYNKGAPAYYDGETVAGFTPDQIAAQNGTVQLAQAGSPLVRSAQNATQNILDTAPGAGNPALQAYIANLTNTANANANSQANGGGRLGSGANATTAATAVTNAALPVQVAQYNTDRNAQLQAATEAPTLANYDFANLARIGTVGDQQQTMQQNVDNAAKAKYDYGAQEPENFLNNYLTQLNQSAANNWTTTNSQTKNTQSQSGGSSLGSLVGAGLSLGSMFLPGGAFAGVAGGLSAGVGQGLSSAAGLGGFTGQSLAGGLASGIKYAPTYGPGF